jgi:hypothetical protein
VCLTDEWSRPWHAHRLLAPYVVLDVVDGRAEEVSSSWSNDLEAQLALTIVRHLLSAFGEHLSAGDIGIIAPYNGQVRHIRRLLSNAFDADVASELDVNSVDGFQGREKSVIRGRLHALQAGPRDERRFYRSTSVGSTAFWSRTSAGNALTWLRFSASSWSSAGCKLNTPSRSHTNTGIRPTSVLAIYSATFARRASLLWITRVLSTSRPRTSTKRWRLSSPRATAMPHAG